MDSGITVRRDHTGRLNILCQDEQGGALRQRVLEAWPQAAVYPLTAAALDYADGDLICCGLAGSRGWQVVAHRLDIEDAAPEAVPGAYRVGHAVNGERRILYALGADLAGTLYAIEWLARRATETADGLSLEGLPVTATPALPYRLLWTWDHSTNWALGYEGQMESGVGTAYTKAPEAFVDDYQLLVEWASRHKLNGVIIWGFLRHAHAGVEAAQTICRYAERLGVRILPGIGTSYYGGFYYEGDHPFSTRARLRRHPQCAARDRHGRPTDRLCPSDPANQAWLREGTAWLCETFAIGGVNLESGDFMVCYCDRCRKLRQALGGGDPAFFAEMAIALEPVVEEMARLRPDAWVTYGTYTGFNPGPLPPDMGEPDPDVVINLANRGDLIPAPVRRLPPSTIVQWSLTGMVHQEPVPLLAWLHDGCPAALQAADDWPAGLAAPGEHGIGLLHQGSQWYSRGRGHTRYGQELACIKEACLRGAEAGLEGLALTGEASPLNTACELNYLALAHFAYAPWDSLRDFARSTLAPLVGGIEDAEAYVIYLAKAEAGVMTAKDAAGLAARLQHFTDQATRGEAGHMCRRWRWLAEYAASARP